MNFEIGKAITATAVLGALGVSLAVSGPSYAAGKGEVARGKYVVTIGGCNDCHTAGYAESDGKVPEKDWLTGSPLGWRGGWGTTYAVNLRNYIDKMTEKQWLAKAKTLQARPPMPAMNVRAMTDADLKAVYH
ncbi:MAG: cytochrome c precursor, partial [Betaproteobacteria bacterium]